MKKQFDEISSAIIDYSGFEKTVNDIFAGYEKMRFLDLCAIIEGIVLYDKLIVVGDSTIGNFQNSKNLFDNNIAVKYSEPLPPDRNRKKHNQEDIVHRRDWGYSLDDAWYETKRLLGAEKILGVPALRLEREKFYYSENALINVDNKLCYNLYGRYFDLKESLMNFRENISLGHGEYYTIPIPPLPLILLERMGVWDKSVFWMCLLEMRGEYKYLREELMNLKEIMMSAKISPLEKKKKYDKWIKIWNTLNINEKYKSASTNLFLSNVNFINFSGVFSETSLKKVINVNSLIDNLSQWAEKEFYSWKVRLLHETSDNYMKRSDFELNQEIERLFGIRVSNF